MRKTEYNKSYSISQKGSNKGELFKFDDQRLRQSDPIEELPEIDWEELGRKLVSTLRKPIIALKYRLYKLFQKLRAKIHLPWYKVGILGLMIFILLQKNMQFQMDFSSPLALFGAESYGGANDYQKSSLVKPIAWEEVVTNPFAPASPEMLKDKQVVSYIKKYKKVAIAEMNKYGIPASVKMAQALIESRSGNSRLAKSNNNHFGIKCFSQRCAKGHCTNFSDDHHKDFFRKYDSAWESWRAHSKVLSGNRYKRLQNHGKDYKKWAKGLREAGYATDKSYDRKLVRMIEKYELYRLDDQ